MNHLKTGNAFFGAGSYKSYKFLGQELQETGFYDMNARFYMADLGKFGTHDPLSSSTLDPYGYGYNNPIMFADPTGLEGDPVNGGGGPGGPVTPASFGDIPGGYDGAPQLMAGAGANDVAAEQNIQGVVINSKGKASNSASAMPTNCIACSVGSNMSSGFNIPQSSVRSEDIAFKPVLHNGSAMMIGGAGDPLGIWEMLGIVLASSDDPNVKMAIIPLLVVTKNGDDALKVLAAENGALKAEAKTISKEAVAKNGTLTPGPFAGEGYPAVNGHSRNFTSVEKQAIREQGNTFGCHTCGQTSPGTKSGNFILDHQPANALVPNGWPQTFYPHCKYCSASQGGIISGMKRQGILPKISK